MVKEDSIHQVVDARAQATRALCFLVRALRPDWDERGIMAELEKATQPLGDLARAAIDAATTASTKTPAGIGARLRDGWSSQLQPKTTEKPWEKGAYYGPSMCVGCGEHGHLVDACPHWRRPPARVNPSEDEGVQAILARVAERKARRARSEAPA